MTKFGKDADNAVKKEIVTFENEISNKSRLVAFLLCYIFGMFGAHRFYVGKKCTAVIYILTMGLFVIGLIVDLLKIILGKFETPKGYVLKNWITED